MQLKQLKSQHDDPHDAIAAQLRDLAPRVERTSPELGIALPAQDLSVAQDAPATSPASTNDAPLRATPLTDPAPRARSGYGLARVLLIVCTVIAAVVAWRSYGEEAKQRLSQLAPQLLSRMQTSIQSVSGDAPKDAVTQATAPQPAAEPPSAQDTAAATATPQAQSPMAAASPGAGSPPAQAAIPPELASSIESMTQEIASLKQTVEELKAGQQQLTRDVAKAAEQDKLTKQISKPTRPLRRQHASAPAAAPRARKPYLPPQTYSRGQSYTQSSVQREATIPPPAQLPPQPGDTSVPRPPMPLR